MPGLYHPFCHCEEVDLFEPTVDNIKLIVPDGKALWTLTDKKDWINAMGYDADEYFIKVLEKYIKQSYSQGNYLIKGIDKYGVKITLFVDLPGNREKKDKIYHLKSGMAIFPNGKLKCNTYIGGKI